MGLLDASTILCSVIAITAIVWIFIGKPNAAHSTAVQSTAFLAATMTDMIHKGSTLDEANTMHGLHNPDIMMWLMSIACCTVPFIMIIVTEHQPTAANEKWWNLPAKLAKRWTPTNCIIATAATAVMLLLPWVWHLVDPRYHTPFLTAMQPGLAMGILIIAAAMTIIQGRKKANESKPNLLSLVGHILEKAAKTLASTADYAALAGFTITWLALGAALLIMSASDDGNPTGDNITQKIMINTILIGAVGTTIALFEIVKNESNRRQRQLTIWIRFATIAAILGGTMIGSWWQTTGGAIIMAGAATGAAGAAMSIWWSKPTKLIDGPRNVQHQIEETQRYT